VTAFLYDWNMLPIGQQLWLKHLETFEQFPPLQAPEAYNLSEITAQVKKAAAQHPRTSVEPARSQPRCRLRRDDQRGFVLFEASLAARDSP
jgi:hypothetical protein